MGAHSTSSSRSTPTRPFSHDSRSSERTSPICPRVEGAAGDPTVERLLQAIADGALPFTCQGNLNGLAVEGGETLGYEIAATLAAAGETVDRLVVQVGGGALASACVEALREAAALGAVPVSPRLHTVQTEGAWPLRRAFDAVAARCEDAEPEGRRTALAYAAHHRSEFMWPWEHEPHSIAHGILDDETYDWLAVVEGMLTTGGGPLVVDEETLAQANALALEATGYPGRCHRLRRPRRPARPARVRPRLRRRARGRAVHGRNPITHTQRKETR